MRGLQNPCRCSPNPTTLTCSPGALPPATNNAGCHALQDLGSLDAGYDEEGVGTDDSSSTSGASEGKPWLELRCVLAVIRHGDRTPKQKMKVTVTQVSSESWSTAQAVVFLSLSCNVVSRGLYVGMPLSAPV